MHGDSMKEDEDAAVRVFFFCHPVLFICRIRPRDILCPTSSEGFYFLLVFARDMFFRETERMSARARQNRLPCARGI